MAEMKLIVQKIEKIEAHDNADRLEIAFTDILDWPIIVGKDSYKIGDKVVHFPVDCCVDDKMEDILVGDSKIKLKKQRIRAAKIRGVISYGMLCPWEVIKTAYNVKETSKDLMKDLGCHKYEPPVKADSSLNNRGQKTKKRQNREFTKYFSMNHLQNCKGIFDPEDKVIITEKLHGASFRAGWVKRDVTGFWGKTIHFFRKIFDKNAAWEFVYGSRNVQLQNNFHDKSVYKQMVDKYDLKSCIPKDNVIYAEIIGPGIQKNYSYTKEPEIRIYDVKICGNYSSYDYRRNVANYMGIKHVPILARIPFKSLILQYFFDTGSTFDEVIEGVVVETEVETINKHGRKKVKVINPEYLLMKGNTDYH